MSATTLYYRRGSMLRDLLTTLAFNRRKIILIGLTGMIATGAAAMLATPAFRAKSSLLILLGTEYTYRGAAGQQSANNGALTHEQILKTEADILGSDDLHRQVIQQIGLGRLYPQMLKPASGINAWIAKAKSYVKGLLSAAGAGGQSAAKIDPMDVAVTRFASDLSVAVDKESSVINLGFTNPDPQIAAKVLTQLEADYLELRTSLFNDVQAPVLQTRVTALAQQLRAADDALNTFKRDHHIGDFEARRKILLEQQGALETQLRTVEGRVAEDSARLNDLQRQVQLASGGARGNPAAALQSMVQAYRARETQARGQYYGSAAVDRAQSEALQRQTDIASLKARNAFAIEQEVIKTQADLQASLGGRNTLNQQLAIANGAVQTINGDELRLRELQRTLTVADETYRSAAKILDDRRIVENVDAGKRPDVRVMQPPLVPALPQPVRQLVVLAGVLITLLLMGLVALMSHFFRTIYLGPEPLELDTELTVLTTVPDTRALPRLRLVIGPN
ncbi:MAG: hypothetical protein M3Y41_07675 [Pseudomonadota bacterium]|nr:hypothetical protein [Pseudomonadota bacterium]